MAEAVTTQIKEGAKDLVRVPLSKPFVALTVGVLFLTLVVLIEIFKPGLLTGPIRSFLGMVGVKGA